MGVGGEQHLPAAGVTPSAPSLPGHGAASAGTLLGEVDLAPASLSHPNPELSGHGWVPAPLRQRWRHQIPRRVCCILFCKPEVPLRPGSEPRFRGCDVFNPGLPFPAQLGLQSAVGANGPWHRGTGAAGSSPPAQVLSRMKAPISGSSGAGVSVEVMSTEISSHPPPAMMVIFPPARHNGSHSSVLVLGMLALVLIRCAHGLFPVQLR